MGEGDGRVFHTLQKRKIVRDRVRYKYAPRPRWLLGSSDRPAHHQADTLRLRTAHGSQSHSRLRDARKLCRKLAAIPADFRAIPPGAMDCLPAPLAPARAEARANGGLSCERSGSARPVCLSANKCFLMAQSGQKRPCGINHLQTPCE